MTSIPEILTYDYGLDEDTTGRVVRWVSTLNARERYIFYNKLIGLSNRRIATRIGLSHTYVSSTIRSWESLREIID